MGFDRVDASVAAAQCLAFETEDVVSSKLQGLQANGFIGHDSLALEQHLPDEPQAHGNLKYNQPPCPGI
jgi:hypothetical protein